MAPIKASGMTTDAIANAVEAARSDGLTPEQFVRLLWEAWRDDINQEMASISHQFDDLLAKPAKPF